MADGEFARVITEWWTKTVEGLPGFLWRLLGIVLIFIAAKAVIGIATGVGRRLVKKREERSPATPQTQRYTTGVQMVVALIRYLVYFLAAVSVLSVLGLITTAISVVTAAGIGGIIVGFGAQNLVKDFFTGIAMLFENQFLVGEYVCLAGKSGTVEEITLRTTVLRAFTGELITIPNGSIDSVVNYTRGNITVYLSAHIAAGEDIEKAMRVISEALDGYAGEHPETVASAVCLGVSAITDAGVDIRFMVTAPPGQQWAAERETQRAVYEALKKSGADTSYLRLIKVEQGS